MPRVLYIAPVLPRRHGRGLAQRAYRTIEALSARSRVRLLTTERVDPAAVTASGVHGICAQVTVLPLARWAPGAIGRRVLKRFLKSGYYAWYRRPLDWPLPARRDRRRLVSLCGPSDIDLVYVHRLYMLPILESMPALARLPVCLDLDDVESTTHARLAALARLNGDRRLACVLERDAAAYRALERESFRRVDRVIVCSETDRARLVAAGGPSHVDVLPNVVDVPVRAPGDPPRAAAGPFVFLFVGTLDYYPNRDAVVFFCRDVVPRVRAQTARPFEVRIVTESGPDIRRLVPAVPELSWAPPGADLTHEYAAAGAAIVPIRAGGGTRIKALEAFANRVPVIATAIGVEGLDVRPGEHALIGDEAAELAAHACGVIADAALGAGLADRALALVQRAYTPDVLRRRVDDLVAAMLPGGRAASVA
jgi:glycosyltransferase involved in cell wall biosynthesis